MANMLHLSEEYEDISIRKLKDEFEKETQMKNRKFEDVISLKELFRVNFSI